MDNVVDRSSEPAEPLRTDALTSTYWQARYDEGRTGWDRGGPSPMLGIWLEAEILRPCRILIPGCGRGHEVVALAARGFDVTAVDFAEAAVHSLQTRLREKQLEAVVTQADLLEFTPAEPFAAIYEQTCLCALHPSLWHAYEARLRQWLLPGGLLCALFMQTDKPEGPPFGCDLSAMQRLFSETAGWRWLGDPQRLDHPMGLHELACVIQKTPIPSLT